MGLQLFGKSAATTLVLGASMLALVGTESATAEQVDAANQELDAAGIKGAQLVPGAALEELTAKAGRVEAAEKAQAEAEKKAADLQEANTKLTEQVTALGKKPGADATTPVRKDGAADLQEEPTSESEAQQLVEKLHAEMLG
ncbi:hypothetical protein [Hymenobacter canadensis]|uniref:Uncharacterized protein n=1 Tax=Hymenobacter canadensis TaxID=2999067 RepID=A0ABY7LSN0_9BACT|nr:hypothetical protein [Hymenobacter canadensis]WBA42971.1 hypothetical protein O3303_05255 [Hymenobacter canadensis]